MGSAVPSHVCLLIIRTQAESGAHSRDSHHEMASNYFYRHVSSGYSQVYRVTQLHIDGVHCRESTGTGPVVLQVVPVVSAAAISVITM